MKPPRSILEPRADLLARRRVPAPPPELAAKVLAAARVAAAVQAPRDWTDRLWESGLARLLWGTATGALLAANLAATGPATIASPRAASLPLPVAGATAAERADAGDPTDFASSLLPRVLRRQGGNGAEQRRQLAAVLDDGAESGGAGDEKNLRANDTRPRAAAGRC